MYVKINNKQEKELVIKLAKDCGFVINSNVLTQEIPKFLCFVKDVPPCPPPINRILIWDSDDAPISYLNLKKENDVKELHKFIGYKEEN